MLNSSGQEFASFKLLVDAVMVLFILVIILGILQWVSNMKLVVSEQRLFEGLRKAVNSPDGTVVSEDDLAVREGAVYSSVSLGEFAKIPPACVEISAGSSSAFSIVGNRMIKINKGVQTNVYYKCQKETNSCDLFCAVRFGEPFPAP